MVLVSPMISSAAVTSPFTNLSKDLSFGMYAQDVRVLQQCLKQDLVLYPEGVVSGYFGVLTEKAVQRFQIKNSIISYGTAYTTGFGRVGPKTREKLNAFCAASQQSSVPTKSQSVPPQTPAPPPTSVQPASTQTGTKKSSTPYRLTPEQKQAALQAWNQINVDTPLGAEGPGKCTTIRQCTDYCAVSSHYTECLLFLR
ncbi:MAG: hypothetical protein G01um101449_308 [Parcubacteria group bacterium Gr01-1014_49]|nr:MAG: hypothetical protein G01um101449_308 [Parcubacteria group bacterium Gr01-1014_49]